MPPARLRASKLGSPKPTGSPPPRCSPHCEFCCEGPQLLSPGAKPWQRLWPEPVLRPAQRSAMPLAVPGGFLSINRRLRQGGVWGWRHSGPRGGHLLSFWGAGMLWHPPAGSARGFGGATRKRGNQSISRREAGVSPASPSISSAPRPARYLDCKIKLF